MNFKDIHKKFPANVSVLTVRVGKLTVWDSIANSLLFMKETYYLFCKKYTRVMPPYFLIFYWNSILLSCNTSWPHFPSLQSSKFPSHSSSPPHTFPLRFTDHWTQRDGVGACKERSLICSSLFGAYCFCSRSCKWQDYLRLIQAGHIVCYTRIEIITVSK